MTLDKLKQLAVAAKENGGEAMPYDDLQEALQLAIEGLLRRAAMEMLAEEEIARRDYRRALSEDRLPADLRAAWDRFTFARIEAEAAVDKHMRRLA